MPDQWGVKRAENLLTSLQGVLSARVVVSPMGEVTEIHVLTQAGIQPKQMVRNVESALLAQLGLKIDHRKVSVAQTAEVRPIDALERSAVHEQALKRGVVFKSVEVRPGRAHRVAIAVTLEMNGAEHNAVEEVADTERSRVQGAARATVEALDKSLGAGTVELEGAKMMDAFDLDFVMAGVHVLDGRRKLLLVGTCEIKNSVEQAAVLAVLDATNRWVQTTQK
ncbi:MAG TPA: hypothetical protein VGI83_04355 [Gemmatimonadales bacterium]|jgi:hypothetical protein